MNSDRLKNVAVATGLVAAGKIGSDIASNKLGNPFVGGAVIAGVGLFVVKGDKGTYLAAGALADIAEEIFRKVI